MLPILLGLLITFISFTEIECTDSGCYYDNYCWKYCNGGRPTGADVEQYGFPGKLSYCTQML